VSAFISCTCECHAWDMYVLAFNLNFVPHFLTFAFYSQSWESVGCIRLTQDGWSVLFFCEHCNKRHRICWLAKWCQGLCFMGLVSVEALFILWIISPTLFSVLMSFWLYNQL
jgi:hypothetical protein